MLIRFILTILISFTFFSCSKKEVVKNSYNQDAGYKIYAEAVSEMNLGNFFFASKLFSDAELSLRDIRYASKSALLSGYCLYRINFYDQSQERIDRFIERYPADKNLPYAYYLSTIISFEKILDEKKDLEPVLKTKEKILFFLEKFPNTEYAIDLKFKLNLVNNQLAAKEVYIARYYMTTQKWIPAINRLKNVVNNYQETVFIEEALHRLVEVYYKLGLEEEAKSTAKILGYNYNSSEWYKKSYSILNKDYKIKNRKKETQKDDGLIKKVIDKILN
tara:strand:- start:25 stop:852 length:828 start_codon:yes stop_codon:yes gene_type:complete